MSQVVYSEASPNIGVTEYSLASASTTLAEKTEKGVYAVVLDLDAVIAGDRKA